MRTLDERPPMLRLELPSGEQVLVRLESGSTQALSELKGGAALRYVRHEVEPDTAELAHGPHKAAAAPDEPEPGVVLEAPKPAERTAEAAAAAEASGGSSPERRDEPPQAPSARASAPKSDDDDPGASSGEERRSRASSSEESTWPMSGLHEVTMLPARTNGMTLIRVKSPHTVGLLPCVTGALLEQDLFVARAWAQPGVHGGPVETGFFEVRDRSGRDIATAEKGQLAGRLKEHIMLALLKTEKLSSVVPATELNEHVSRAAGRAGTGPLPSNMRARTGMTTRRRHGRRLGMHTDGAATRAGPQPAQARPSPLGGPPNQAARGPYQGSEEGTDFGFTHEKLAHDLTVEQCAEWLFENMLEGKGHVLSELAHGGKYGLALKLAANLECIRVPAGVTMQGLNEDVNFFFILKEGSAAVKEVDRGKMARSPPMEDGKVKQGHNVGDVMRTGETFGEEALMLSKSHRKVVIEEESVLYAIARGLLRLSLREWHEDLLARNLKILRRCAIFDDLDDVEASRVAKGFRETKHTKGDVVMTYGDVVDQFVLLLDGEITVTAKCGKDLGLEKPLARLRVGHHFGDIAFFRLVESHQDVKEHHSLVHMCVDSESCTLLRMDKAVMDKLFLPAGGPPQYFKIPINRLHWNRSGHPSPYSLLCRWATSETPWTQSIHDMMLVLDELRLEPGQTLFEEGTVEGSLYVLTKGVLEVSKTLDVEQFDATVISGTCFRIRCEAAQQMLSVYTARLTEMGFWVKAARVLQAALEDDASNGDSSGDEGDPLREQAGTVELCVGEKDGRVLEKGAREQEAIRAMSVEFILKPGDIAGGAFYSNSSQRHSEQQEVTVRALEGEGAEVLKLDFKRLIAETNFVKEYSSASSATANDVKADPQVCSRLHAYEKYLEYKQEQLLGGASLFSKPTVDDLEEGALIGCGAFARVRLAHHKRTKELFAMKIMSKALVCSQRMGRHIAAERTIMASMDHPFITQLYCTTQTPTHVALVMTYAPGGDVFSLLEERGTLNTAEAQFYTAQCVCALEHVHQKHVVYRDLKPENMLLRADGYIMLTDFGFAKQLKGAGARTHSLCGTPEYLAPEVVLNQGHGVAADWWALGVVVFQLLTGQVPFGDDAEQVIAGKIDWDVLRASAGERRDENGSGGRRPSWAERGGESKKGITDLVKKLLTRDQSRRLGALTNSGVSEARAHGWFAGISWERLLQRKQRPPYVPSIANQGDVSLFDPCEETEEHLAGLEALAKLQVGNVEKASADWCKGF